MTSLCYRYVWRHKWRKMIFGFRFRKWRCVIRIKINVSPKWSLFLPKYVNLYRSILKLWYIDRHMKFFIVHNIVLSASTAVIDLFLNSYIDQYNTIYIGLYKNICKTLGWILILVSSDFRWRRIGQPISDRHFPIF